MKKEEEEQEYQLDAQGDYVFGLSGFRLFRVPATTTSARRCPRRGGDGGAAGASSAGEEWTSDVRGARACPGQNHGCCTCTRQQRAISLAPRRLPREGASEHREGHTTLSARSQTIHGHRQRSAVKSHLQLLRKEQGKSRGDTEQQKTNVVCIQNSRVSEAF